jgi:FdhE protein
LPVDTDAVIRHLEEKERKEGELPQLLAFHLKLLRVQADAERKLAPQSAPHLSREDTNRRIDSANPLLTFDELAPDPDLLADTFDRVITLFADHYAGPPDTSEKLRQLSGYHPGPETYRAWFEGDTLPAKGLPRGMSKDLFGAIITATLKPFLVSRAKTLIGLVDQERWRRGRCPVCGGNPDLSFLAGEQGARWLKCSRCDTEWVFQRLQCPYCDNQDQNDLTYFTDDRGLYRLYVCERCKGYLKAVDLRKTESEVLLPLERLYTLDLDRQAVERGYRPGSH